MERRLGVIAILVYSKEAIQSLNSILSNFSEIILGRMGLPLKEKNLHIISLIVEGDTDQIGSLTGKIGKLSGIKVKSMFTKD
ncbi:MAG TPA: iron-only hydrogenase system regulator [Spirochaetota bacterium]|nr:iron-only hydrogenase system regulator [Spirochaetota bacterium]HPP04155.1 iron-only hydrogenase system regulator [Spirochaetota bacterium]